MIFAYGAPELQIMDMAFADLARRYRLPFFCIGGATDAKVLDAQAGAEMALSLLLSALNGCNLIHDVGYLESGLCFSEESVVLGDELVGMVKRYLAAFEICEDTLALDVIDRVGPMGNFLDDDHTIANYRRDVWYPTVFDRRRFEAWFSDGGQQINKYLQRKAQATLADREIPALSAKQAKTMDEILARRVGSEV
jgi:trimethylamine--corrinoid protein Co-methyltransferase